jgi:non-homologous end joining protein Ku
MELVETKAAGRKPKVVAFRPKKTKDDKLADSLEASLAGLKAARPKRSARG